jgi:hypothetical protein
MAQWDEAKTTKGEAWGGLPNSEVNAGSMTGPQYVAGVVGVSPASITASLAGADTWAQPVHGSTIGNSSHVVKARGLNG